MKICEIFLNPQRILNKEFPRNDVKDLTVAMDNFIKMCGFAVHLNKYVMEPKHQKFTEMIDKSYGSLEVTIKGAIEAAEKAINSLPA